MNMDNRYFGTALPRPDARDNARTKRPESRIAHRVFFRTSSAFINSTSATSAPQSRALPSITSRAALLVFGLLFGCEAARSREDPTAVPLDRFESRTCSISFQGGLLSLHARKKPWAEVLGELTKKTGVHFHSALPLEGSVTVSIVAVPIEKALEHLFGPEADFMLRYPQGADASASSAVPNDVWVLGKVLRGGSQADRENDATPLPGPAASNLPLDSGKALEGPMPTGNFAAAEDTHADRTLIEEQSIDNLIVMTGNQEPQLRIHALAALSEGGLADEGAVRSALDAALDDKNANVRAYAVQALAGRGGPELAAILGRALRDPDPNVRIMAVDQMVPQDQGITLLQEALSDTNETVRTIAAERLKQEPKAAGTE